uniref:Arrestin_C domain-containing protein n=1 Tax=Panagrellus redivivus TaxID=6233 RepID=A0A7E4V002_PANRE
MNESDDRRVTTTTGTRVFKKTSPNAKITTYLGKRDFLDRGSFVDPIDGMVLIDDEYIKLGRKIIVQLNAVFRYGREDLDVLGLTFRKDLIKQTAQVYPPEPENQKPITRLQERLKKKLGKNSFPFWFDIPPHSASSVTLQPAQGDTGKPCGVDYELRTIVATDPASIERPRKSSTVKLAIRKLTYSPAVEGPQPMVDVTKEFLMSPGLLHLEASLDKEMYYHGENIAVNVHIQNNSNRTVRKIKVSVQQTAEICIFTTASYSCDVDKIESSEGFPVGPGGTLSKVYYLCPLLAKNKEKRGLALNGQLKHEDTNLASSTTLSATGCSKEVLGILVTYRVKIRLVTNALSGEIVAELPFTLTHPKPDDEESPREESKKAESVNEGDSSESMRNNIVNLDDDEVAVESPDLNDDDIIFEDFARLRVQQANGSSSANNDNNGGVDIDQLFSAPGTPGPSRSQTNGTGTPPAVNGFSNGHTDRNGHIDRNGYNSRNGHNDSNRV